MSGTGKYTQYAPTATTAHTLLDKLFTSKDAKQFSPVQGLVGKETDARNATLALATAKVVLGVGGIQPSDGVQQGDASMFPQGVNLDYSGKLASIQPPDTAEGKDVVWKNPGDPANSYMPDITSPGPGKTDGKDKDTNPTIAVKDIKPAYVPGAPDTGTRSPSVTDGKVFSGELLGTTGKLGDSGANS